MMEEDKKCWICGNIADSGEHSIKQTDMKTLFGNNAKQANLLYMEEEKVLPLQSFNSIYLKHKVLCKDCNNNKTQPFDRAYEKFINYMNENREEIVYKRYIDFSKIYKNNWIDEQLNLFKYLVKSFGCRLSRFDDPVPSDMIDLFSKKTFQTKLRITFAINENILELYRTKKIKGGIGNSSIGVNQKYLDGIKELDDDSYYGYIEYYDWLEIHYYYNHNADGSLGSSWIADNQFIYLGSSQDNTFIESIGKYNLSKIKWFTLSQFKSIQNMTNSHTFN